MGQKVYRNVIRSKNAIQKALLALLLEGNELDKISISDVCLKANVNRGTFYNHYHSIDEVLGDVENEFMLSLANALQKTDLSSESGRKQFFYDLGTFLRDRQKSAKAIARFLPTRTFVDLKDKIEKTLETSFPKMVRGMTVDDVFLRKVRFFVSGLIGNYINAIGKDSQEEISKASELAYEVSNEMFGSYFPLMKDSSNK
ncbi:MAG: TetR/AcrR family transcriptional regulator [Bacilli bacterium]|jgi:AcrR family transcriptional regulator